MSLTLIKFFEKKNINKMTYRSNLLPKLRDINVGTGMNEVSIPCDKKVNCDTKIKMDLHI